MKYVECFNKLVTPYEISKGEFDGCAIFEVIHYQ
jgi:hypothetical protein